MNETLLPIIVLIPLLLGFVTLFLPNILRYFFRALTLLVSLGALYLAVNIFRQGPLNYGLSVFELNGFEFDMLLVSNPLSAFMLFFTAVFAVLITLYSFKSTAFRKASNIYYGSIMLTLGASAGVLLSNHLLFLLIFWEIVAVSLYLMIATGGKESNFAATKTFAMVGASDAAFLLGLFIVWVLSETFVVSDISLATTGALPIIAFLLLMTAAITKA
ncbi:MAG: proton-conducting transporter transmembrane domain-containing protein, partial [Planctomycetota bacterium]